MSARRGALALALGSGVTGILAYAVFAVCTRVLGPEAAAPVSVLWTWWGLAGAALTFPVHHWISRSAAVHGDTAAVRRSLPRLAAAALAVSVLAGGVSWLARDQLFHRPDAAFPLLVAALTASSCLMGVARGGLSARARFVAVATTLVVENAIRLVAVAALAGLGNTDPVAYGACIVLGHVAVLAFPGALVLGPADPAARREPVLAFLSGAASAQLLSQVVLTSGPVLLALTGGSPADVTALFAGLALFRAPLTVVLGLVAQLTGRLTRLVVERRTTELARLRRGLVSATLALTGLGVVFGWLIGPSLVRLVFGPDVSLDRSAAALLAGGSVVAVANLVQGVTLLAHGRPGLISSAWCLGALTAVPFIALPIDDLTRLSAAFVAAEAGAWAALLSIEAHLARSLRRRPATAP